MNIKSLVRPQYLALLILAIIAASVVFYFKSNVALEPVPSSAALANNLSWIYTEPAITVSTKIYRTTTGFLEDPDEQYLIATVDYPTSTYSDSSVSEGVTYYYSGFQIDDAAVAFDPFYRALIPTDSGSSGGGGGGGSSGGGGGGGSSGGGGSTSGPNIGSKRLVNISGTYYLIEDGVKKGITSPGILNSCGFDFPDAVAPTSADTALPSGSLLLPCDGALVKSQVDQTVYLISRGQRYGFTSGSVFLGLGHQFSNVLVVTNPELQALSRATNLDNPAAAHLAGTDINVNGTVYYIDSNNTKRAYPSLEVYNSWHIDNDFSKVVPANQADLALPTGSNVASR